VSQYATMAQFEWQGAFSPDGTLAHDVNFLEVHCGRSRSAQHALGFFSFHQNRTYRGTALTDEEDSGWSSASFPDRQHKREWLQPFRPAQHCREHTAFVLLLVRSFWWIAVRICGYRKIVVQIPLQLTFEGSDPSEAVRVAIEREVERLEKHNRHIIGCRVAVIAHSHKHRHGSGFNVHISLTVPPHESVIVSHDPPDDKRYAHEHIEAAVKDAFATARRQLDDLA